VELFHDILLDKYHNEEFVCGNFRAAAASNSMIYQGSSSALLKGEVKITSLGLIDHSH
jgi:cyanophycinase